METTELAHEICGALRALSHEHRLLMVSHLISAERSVGELEKHLGLTQPAVSQQLARLRMDDLVSARREGRTIYYKANADRLYTVLSHLCSLLGYTLSPAAVASLPRSQPEEAEAFSLAEGTAV